MGLVRMNGRAHEYYRRMVTPTLHPHRVNALGDNMAQIAATIVDSWPVGKPIDLRASAYDLARSFAVGLLFSNDRLRGMPIAKLIDAFAASNWSLKVPLTRWCGPISPHGRMMKTAEQLERSILAWADSKRGHLDPNDLLSLIVNNPDEYGQPVSSDKIAGHTPTLFGAAYETCQNVLIWTLILLDQHPEVASDLHGELKGALGPNATPTLVQVVELPLLDAVVKESMRILPAVPQQFRVALSDTTLAGSAVKSQSRVLLSAFLTNRNPDLYPEPDRFKPERWATIEPSPYEYGSFSAGPRRCPGSSFGLSAVKMALATILTRYRPAIIPGSRIDYRVAITLSPRGAVPAVLHRPGRAFVAAPLNGSIRNLAQLPH